MLIYEPSYYAGFRCLGGSCPDSCCQEWEVLVDPEAAARYRTLPGALGDRLRSVMKTEDAETWFTLENRRCPMWRADGLCRIQAELGENALCQTCAQFPRLRHDYGTFAELGLELSCPEAARLILAAPYAPPISREIPGGESPDYDPQVMDTLLESRKILLALTDDRTYSPDQILKMLLLYAYVVDDVINFPTDAPALPDPRSYANVAIPNVPGTGADLFALYLELEILTSRWEQRLRQGPVDSPWTDEFRPLIRYFVERYWLQAVSDQDLVARAKFIVVSCLMIRLLGGNLLLWAQRYSKEIENDAENVDAIMDAVFTAPELSDAAILHML